MFAGDKRVWYAVVAVVVPLLGVLAYYCLRPNDYNTGSDNAEVVTYIAPDPAGKPLCLQGLLLPAGTARMRMQMVSRTQSRPPLQMVLRVGGRVVVSRIGPVYVKRPDRVSVAVFRFPEVPARPAIETASACITATDLVNWGGTPLPSPPASPGTVAGVPVAGRVAVWYLPPMGAQRSYISQLGSILDRAALFRPSPIGAWSYYLLLIAVVPLLALFAVRLLALAATGRLPRRVLLWLYVIAVLNFLGWALISPPFQAPDEVDHFAYTQSLVERGEEPSRDAGSPLLRWSTSEGLALEDTAFPTDHQIGDTTVPWLALEQHRYEQAVALLHPSAANGGGYETAASHGPVYYAALAPAYAIASSSPFSQLTLMRFASALIGALAVLFTFLLARELAPGRPWLAVLAALFVSYQPMYAFISGAVNNDVGVNAGAAALEYLLIRVLRRGITIRTGALIALIAALLPLVKETSLSLYPLLAAVLVVALWRHHSRADARAWVTTVLTAIAVSELAALAFSAWAPAATPGSGGGAAPSVGANASSVSLALHHPTSFLTYLWEVFLPKLPFMHAHFPTGPLPAYTIFVQRGWAAFGWYDVLFPEWVYSVITAVMLAAIPVGLCAAVRERRWLRANWLYVAAVVAMPVLVIVGFEAAFYTPGIRPVIGEFGRYVFPAIGPIAVIVVGSLHAFGRRGALLAGSALLGVLIVFCFTSQLLTISTFYA